MPDVTVKAHSTIGTMLEVSADGTTWEQMCKIKSFPALGGAPEQIESTDLEDENQTFVPGVQAVEAMDFTANYTIDAFQAVKAKEKQELHYRIKLGKAGTAGMATWTGQHSVYVNEGEVNGLIEMTISSTPSSKIEVGAVA